ncbi:cobalamin adenosyltransferase [Alkaliphilus peptidifermentans]|uniref:Ethanolamine utilization cobalamin adenosyltransferase n=1 Tax=Alkaliphilus peptidifermentans DSM 18978 TaxID=1120976 RepID=A0A1G5KWB2_9FIRM|nr:cobalamin adenosyltransferase [Alkaliphilus peptidifermentans]SCZ04418.1 ethanolamine utilization cobalamin adenosyltransferase [Alkaliphilus peptidifermentans DSM 18978]
MKVLTEGELRWEFKNKFPKTYTINSRILVTPSAMEYLKEKKIELILEKEDEPSENIAASGSMEGNKEEKNPVELKYKCYHSGGLFESKPEHMTQLYGNLLVIKDNPRIQLRGKLDSFQAQILELQVFLDNCNEKKILEDLMEVLSFVRNLLRAEVLEEPFDNCKILGLDEGELRRMSHNPEKFFGVRHFLPEYSMGVILIKLNSLRSAAREIEIVGITAFVGGNASIERQDIIQALNRLSSCLYIMMCRWQGGYYN